MKSKTKPLLYYLFYTFLISWTAWLVLWLTLRFNLIVPGSAFFYVMLIVGGISPAIVAYKVLKRAGSVTKLNEFLRFSFDVNQPRRDYMLFLFFVVLHLGMPILLGGSEPGVSPLYGLLYLPVMFAFAGIEEIGWHGYFEPELDKRVPFIPAVLMTFAALTVWHLPLLFIPGTPHFHIPLAEYLLELISISFSMAVIRYVSGKVFLCVVFHTITNTWYLVYAPTPHIGTYLAFCFEVSMAILVFLYVHRSRRIKPDNRHNTI